MNILSTNSENQFIFKNTVSWFPVASPWVTSGLIDRPGFHVVCFVSCSYPFHLPSAIRMFLWGLELSLARYTYNPSKQEMGAGGPGGVQSQPQSQLHHELETSLVYLRLYLKPKQKSDNLTLTSLLRSLLMALLTFSTGKADPWHFLNVPLFCLESFMVFLWVQESSP